MDGESIPGLHARRNLHLDTTVAVPGEQSLSQALPSVLVSSSATSLSPTTSRPVTPVVNKARGELRKLLAHLLSRLKTRPSAPSVYDSIKVDSAGKESYRLGAVVETFKSAVRYKLPKELSDPADFPGDEDDVEENDQGYSTDITYDLMSQLRDVCTMSAKQGWQIFESAEAGLIESQGERLSLRRLRRSSRQLGQRSRSPSPSDSSQTTDMLMECINILASVVSEDCRFKILSPRVFRPSYSLQSVTLDVAQSLIATNRNNAKVLSRIGFAMIPAFASFNPSLHTRLLAFFEDGIIRGMLDDLRSFQGLGALPTKGSALDEDCWTSHNFGLDDMPEDNPVTKTPLVAIQVEEAVNDSSQLARQQGWLQWSSTSSPVISSTLATVAPSQPLLVYHLSSLVPPLLVAILENIDPFEDDIKDIPRFYRLHTLLHTIISMKPDAYLDVLEVVAYHGYQTRRRALAVLATFWPKSLGHVVVGKPLPIISLADSLPGQTPSLRLQYAKPRRDHVYAHEFVPWHFFRRDPSSGPDYSNRSTSCQSCYGAIVGFGLLCPFCLTGVHLNCYDSPDGTFHGQYLSASGNLRQCLMSFSNISTPRRDMEPEIVTKASHTFRMANLFTLALCLVCRKPLWGHVKQGMKCSTCMQFIHISCMSTSLDTFPSCPDFILTASHVTIDWAALTQTFVDHYNELLIEEQSLLTKSYEEVSVFYSILWTQLKIFDNGIIYKSIVVNQSNFQSYHSGKENQVGEFELHHYVGVYETFLSSRRLGMSYALQEYYELNKCALSNRNFILFDWPLLNCIASIIKTPLPSQNVAVPPQPNLLQVHDHDIEENLDPPSHPYELVPLSQMRKALGLEFYVRSDCAADYMLSHISLVGFFHRTDLKDGLCDGTKKDEVLCCFPLPSGLDLSTSVETLVVAIDACLRDIDVGINEHGFLLLVRRFWPTGAASEYALTRLMKIVLSWALTEDDRLVVIARDQIALNHSLPGVRSSADTQPWPSATRHAKTGVQSGGEYVSCRKQLLVRHALPWLTAVHELDTSLYTTCLYDYCVDVVNALDPRQIIDPLYPFKVDHTSQAGAKIAWGEAVLKSIIRLTQLNIALSSFTAILVKWFDSVAPPGTTIDSIKFKSLSRLFNHDGDSRRTSTMNDSSLGLSDPIQIDPWDAFNDVASQGLEGLERSVSWLRVMAHSAVDIPTKTLKHMLKSAREVRASFQMMMSLLESTMTFMWVKTFGSDGLDVVMVEVNDIWADELLHHMGSDEEIGSVHDFIRYSLVTCLLVYGCERQSIISLGLVRPEEVRSLPQRRRVARASPVPTALEIDPKLVAILVRYVSEGPNSVCALVAKFLNTVVSESALLETHEIDRFILVNGDALSKCAWRFYDLSPTDLSDIRTSFLLRILVVDPQPFNVLLQDILQTSGKWQVRFQTVTRLFQIVLDVTSPCFGVEGRQWKSNVTDVINHFFRALWMDDREEIRLAVDTWAHTLLPAHLQAISSCWDEHMSKSPMSDRARLSAFLVQLYPHFPAWHLISWETIVEVLSDDDLARSNGENEDGYTAAAHLSVYGDLSTSGEPVRTPYDPDSDALQVSLVFLSLQMIGDGISIDLVHLLKIKLIFAKFLGFSPVSYHPSAGGGSFHVQLEYLEEFRPRSFSCISPLVRVLDAPHVLSLPPSSTSVTWNGPPITGIVGDVFVDIVGNLWEKTANVQTLPYSVLRALLECMLLVISKHDINNPALRHVEEVIGKAVKRVTDLVASATSHDLRHLCLSVMMGYMQGYPMQALKVLSHQVLVLARLTVSLRSQPDDPLVLRVKEFLEAAFVQYEVSGLFWLLSKQGRMPDDFFFMLQTVGNDASPETNVPGETLRDSIVRDTLSKVAANTGDRAIPDVLYNLNKYISICHHRFFPSSLIQHIGFRLTAIARQTADLGSSIMNRSAQGFDPNPLLLMSATVMQHNQVQSTGLLTHIETLLRTALVRFEVHLETLNRVLHVTFTLYQRAEINGAELPSNNMATCVLEVLSDTLKGKARALPSTTTNMLEAVTSLHNDKCIYISTPNIVRAGADAAYYLAYPMYREIHGRTEFATSLAAAKLILHACIYDPSILLQSLTGDTHNLPPVRFWNLMTLAALTSADSDASTRLLALFPNFVLAYITSLKRPPSGSLGDSVAPDVNHAFASIKLWLLIVRKSYHERDVGDNDLDADAAERMVWNELWPSFERLLEISLSGSHSGETPPLLTFVWGCVSDLMLFIRQAQSVVALDTSSHASILNKLRELSRGESGGNKFGRALRSIAEPPVDLPFDVLVTHVANDVLAAEKLQAIEVYKQGGAEKRREHMDKRRVEARDFRTTY